MLNEIFKTYYKIDKQLQDNKIQEVQIRREGIDFFFANEKELTLNDIRSIEKEVKYAPATSVTTYQDEIILSFRELDQIRENNAKDNTLQLFSNLIDQLSEAVCTCPNLEVAVAEYYVKFYIDKPHIEVEKLLEVDKMFGAKGQLELGSNRPYLLYVRDEDIEQ